MDENEKPKPIGEGVQIDEARIRDWRTRVTSPSSKDSRKNPNPDDPRLGSSAMESKLDLRVALKIGAGQAG